MTTSGLAGFWPINPLPARGAAFSAMRAFLLSGSNSGRSSALARSMARKPRGKNPSETSAWLILAARLVTLSFDTVAKPWSAAMIMSVVAARPRSSNAWRSCFRLSSAFLMAAREVGPLMPGLKVWIGRVVLLSIPLQYGVPLDMIRGATTRIPRTSPLFQKGVATMVTKECFGCEKVTSHEHLHDCDPGIPETHMVGSERFVW